MAGLPPGADENWRNRIASASKIFTAAAIMLLDQRGKIDIEDVLTDMIPGTDVPYLADSPNYAIPCKDRMTIRQILSHRAGIFNVFNNPIPESSATPFIDYTKLPEHLAFMVEVGGAARVLAGYPGLWTPRTER